MLSRFATIAAASLLAIGIARAAPPDFPGNSTTAPLDVHRLPSIGELPADPQILAASNEQTPMAPPLSLAPPPPVGSRANTDLDAEAWMNPYLHRAEGMSQPEKPLGGDPSAILPMGYVPWWDPIVRRPTGMAATSIPVSVDWLVQSALEHSPHIQAISTEPSIRQTVLVEEEADFDWRTFLRTSYDKLNDPVGNTLTTGNNDTRFRDHQWSTSGGLRRQNLSGGQFEAAQRLGWQNNNSNFLIPKPQGTSRLELTYSQPLLNGAGVAYNESRIVLARIDWNAAGDEVMLELQDHLLRVTQAYWELYRARAELQQRVRVLHEAQAILRDLEGRQGVDSLERQILRARSAVTNRESEIVRAVTSIRNAESQLRLLVNDPALINSGRLEFTPRDAPVQQTFPVSVRDGLNTALLNRPDISRAIRNMRATTTRLGVANNEILPKLDLLVSTYVAGLEGDGRFFSAYGDQFSEGGPGYAVGLLFDTPIGNRAAHARLSRRQLELVRATSEFRATVEKSLTETEVAIREVHTAYQEMVGKYKAMLAADNETNYLIDRWQTLPGIDDSSTLLLEDLLDSQERRADEEAAFVRAQVSYSDALVQLRKAMGTLLRLDQPLYGPGDALHDLPVPAEPLPPSASRLLPNPPLSR